MREKAKDIVMNVVLPKKPPIPMMHDKMEDMIAKPTSCLKSISTLSNKRDTISVQRKRENKKMLTTYHCFDRLLGSLNIVVTP